MSLLCPCFSLIEFGYACRINFSLKMPALTKPSIIKPKEQIYLKDYSFTQYNVILPFLCPFCYRNSDVFFFLSSCPNIWCKFFLRCTCDLAHNCLRNPAIVQEGFDLFFHEVAVPPVI